MTAAESANNVRSDLAHQFADSGMSMRELAAASDVNFHTASRIIGGPPTAALVNLSKVAEVFGLELILVEIDR